MRAGKYHDDYRDKVMELIEAKAEGNEIATPEAAERAAPVVDLMAALEASLARAEGGRTTARGRRAADGPAHDAAAGRRRSLRSTDRGRGRELSVSNLDKVLWPETGLTKGEMLDYYARIAPVDGPPLGRAGRDPEALPQRGGQGSFFEKNCPSHKPAVDGDGRDGRRRLLPGQKSRPPSSGWPTWPPSSSTRRWRPSPT